MKAKIICLTGNMASGKNFACSILENLDCVSVDADKLSHKAIENAKDKIIKTFGEEAKLKKINLLNEDNSINRKELAKIVFSSKENLKKQEDIVHPEVNSLMEDFISENSSKTVILNATVLYKTSILTKCDAIIFIKSNFFLRLFRAKKRDKSSIFRILQRFYAQKNLFSKYQKYNADIFKVENNGSKKQLEKKLIKILNLIEAL